MTYNLNLIIQKTIDKTRLGVITWKPYVLAKDTNPYSNKTFSTIKNLLISESFFAPFCNGFLFLVPSCNGDYYLFMQFSPIHLPIIIDTKPSEECTNLLKELYDYVKKSSKPDPNPADTFLRQLLS